MFPVPRITESFVDSVIYKMGWYRYTDKYPVVERQLNADYLTPDGIAELKIFEEEGLLKKEHQEKLSALYEEFLVTGDEVDIEIENVPEKILRAFENQVAKPFQNAIKKSSKQIRQSSAVTGNTGDKIIIAVNNGFSYLNADNFERIFVARCKRDSRSIDYAACITVDYHQGDFDAYIFCTTRVHQVNAKKAWHCEDEFVNLVGKKFNDAMTIMMQDQLNPSLWEGSLEPVKDIRFERAGVKYVREAPFVPDSR